MKIIDADKLKEESYNAYPSIDHYCYSREVVDVADIDKQPKLPTMQSNIVCNYCRKNNSGCEGYENHKCFIGKKVVEVSE